MAKHTHGESEDPHDNDRPDHGRKVTSHKPAVAPHISEHAYHGRHVAHDDHVHAKHGADLLGWLKNLYGGHSHSVADKIDNAMESNERGIWALKISMIGLGLTALFQVVIVFFSGSVALLADTIHNFADAATSIPLWIAFALAKRGASRRFTYGYGKTEDVAGVVIVLVIFFSACVAAYQSVVKIIDPQPVEYLGWVTAAAIIGFIGNEAVAIFRIRVGKEIGSAALIADGNHSRVDGFTSLAVLIGVIGVWAGFPILDPLVGIAITIAILFIVKDTAKSIWVRLIDGIEPQIMDEIEHASMHVEGVRDVKEVRARWVGHKIFVDLAIGVDADLPVSAAHAITEAVEQALREHVRTFGGAVVHVYPVSNRQPVSDSATVI
ncbi:MAG: cation diffusion facilitator family transporter [Gammaproteobacteria bacterium]